MDTHGKYGVLLPSDELNMSMTGRTAILRSDVYLRRHNLLLENIVASFSHIGERWPHEEVCKLNKPGLDFLRCRSARPVEDLPNPRNILQPSKKY